MSTDLVSNFRKVVSDLGNIDSEEDQKIFLQAVDDLISQSQAANRAATNQDGTVTTAIVSSAESPEKPKKNPRTKLELGLIFVCGCLFVALLIASGLAIYFSTSEIESEINSAEKVSALWNHYGRCPAGFDKVAYSCYKLMAIKQNYSSAVQNCKTVGGKLAEPRTEWEDNELISYARPFITTQFWIAASDRKLEGRFVWESNGDRIKIFLWLRSEPNNGDYIDGQWENCVAVNLNNGQRKWSDEQCRQRKEYVCQAELKYNVNPDSKQVCPDGYLDKGIVCYRFLPELVDFDSAVSNCKKTGGILVEPRSYQESCSLGNLLRTESSTEVWLGATDKDKEGTFKWLSDNQVVTFEMFNSGSQDNWKNGEDCLEMTRYLHWNDLGCSTSKINAVCQVPSETGLCFKPWLCHGQRYLCFSCIPLKNGPKCRLVQLNSYSSQHTGGYRILYARHGQMSYKDGRCNMRILLASLGHLVYREKYHVVDNVVVFICLYSIDLKFQMEFWSRNMRNIQGKSAMEIIFWSNKNPMVFKRLRCRYRH